VCVHVFVADGLLQEENEDREGGNGYEMGSRELLDNFTPDDSDMATNEGGVSIYVCVNRSVHPMTGQFQVFKFLQSLLVYLFVVFVYHCCA